MPFLGLKGVLQKKSGSAPLPKAVMVQVQRALELLRTGGVVAFPTDTVYGLGADFSSVPAVQRVIAIKGRPEEMGLPLLLADVGQLSIVARDVPEAAQLLARHFWPGALTLVLRRSANVPGLVTGGRTTVAVRVPDHPVPRELARGLGRPITGTSANRSGQPSALTSAEARKQLGSTVDLIIKEYGSSKGLPSTIIDVTGPVLKLVRTGGISLALVKRVYRGEIIIEDVQHAGS